MRNPAIAVLIVIMYMFICLTGCGHSVKPNINPVTVKKVDPATVKKVDPDLLRKLDSSELKNLGLEPEPPQVPPEPPQVPKEKSWWWWAGEKVGTNAASALVKRMFRWVVGGV